MSSDKEKRKAEIMVQVEKLVDQMLSEAPETNIHINDIERLAVGTGEDIKQVLAQQLSEESEDNPPICSECGKQMPLKDYRTKQVVTQAGEVKVKRAYYYCETCKAGHFPPG